MTNTTWITTPDQFEELRRAVTTVEIPAGFDRWHPNEITAWLTDVEEDETASDADIDRARQAVSYALGIEPADMEGGATATVWTPTMLPSTATAEEISNELERRGQRGRTVARSNGTTARMVVVPTDLDRWHPNEITAWLTGYEEDGTVTAADLDRARRAAAHALGVDQENPEAGA